jgi:tetratricopeptide (TPR) repeat protein
MPKNSPHDAAYAQIRTWLLTAELYLRLDQADAAEQCANEARQLYPLSYHILYLRGTIHQYRGDYETAKIYYQNSLSIHPSHLDSLQALGLVHLHLGSPRLAEQTLRAAIKLDPHNHVSWVNLGTVLETIEEECDTAAKCFATAQSIQASSPILPFSTIPLCFE